MLMILLTTVTTSTTSTTSTTATTTTTKLMAQFIAVDNRSYIFSVHLIKSSFT